MTFPWGDMNKCQFTQDVVQMKELRNYSIDPSLAYSDLVILLDLKIGQR